MQQNDAGGTAKGKICLLKKPRRGNNTGNRLGGKKRVIMLTINFTLNILSSEPCRNTLCLSINDPMEISYNFYVNFFRRRDFCLLG